MYRSVGRSVGVRILRAGRAPPPSPRVLRWLASCAGVLAGWLAPLITAGPRLRGQAHRLWLRTPADGGASSSAGQGQEHVHDGQHSARGDWDAGTVYYDGTLGWLAGWLHLADTTPHRPAS